MRSNVEDGPSSYSGDVGAVEGAEEAREVGIKESDKTGIPHSIA